MWMMNYDNIVKVSENISEENNIEWIQSKREHKQNPPLTNEYFRLINSN